MEVRLETYRIRKRRKQTIENLKQKLFKFLPFQQQKEDLKIDIPENNDQVFILFLFKQGILLFNFPFFAVFFF